MVEFEELYKLYFDDVFRFLRGLTANEHLAEELTAETFFKALRGINDFKGDCDVRVWLCQIAKNSYFTYLKKQNQITYQYELKDVELSENNIESLLIDKELAFKLHQILHDLEEPYKEIFTLRVFGELSFKKIAMLFGKTEHWACVTYHRAKGKIQKRMEEYYED